MKIPTKFEINTEDFKIHFDNKKKTHVCESLDTGEKTNIGVLGILMQMGIIKPVEEGVEQKIKTLSERLNDLETKINEIIKKVDSASGTEEKVIEEPKEIETQEEQVGPKSEIKERIMRKVLETAEKPETKDEPAEEIEVEEIEAKDSDVRVESEEEINNWLDI